MRHHTGDSFFDDALRVHLERTPQGHGGQTTRVSGVTVTELTLALVCGNANLVGVDDDDVVTTVNVRCKNRLTLAPQQVSSLNSEAAEHHVGGVDDVPLTGNVTALRVESRQHDSLKVCLELPATKLNRLTTVSLLPRRPVETRDSCHIANVALYQRQQRGNRSSYH